MKKLRSLSKSDMIIAIRKGRTTRMKRRTYLEILWGFTLTERIIRVWLTQYINYLSDKVFTSALASLAAM